MGMGISMAGKLNPQDGMIISSGQYPFLKGESLVDIVRNCCNVPVSIQNDAHSAALAELNLGCLKSVKNAAVIVLGTGIGGAIILDKKIYEGQRFCAAEFSLIRVNGKEGIENSWMYRGGGAVGLINLVKEALNTEDELTGMEIFKMAEKNEKVLEAIRKYCQITAVQIYNLQAIFDLDVYAIGGGISAQPMLIELIAEYLYQIFEAEKKYDLAPSMPKIIPCKYRNDANLLGAWYDFNNRIIKNQKIYV